MRTPKIYQTGNAWQKHAYCKMSEYFQAKGVIDFGIPNGGLTPYKHLLTESDEKQNFINEDIYNAVSSRFDNHKAGDLERVKLNTVASQTYCFNLFVPLQLNPKLASKLFSNLLAKTVEVKHIEIEFTPNKLDEISGFDRNGNDETIGDQSTFGGTDADVAVFYTDINKKKGVILIEFKFIEHKFSICSSYKKAEANPICSSSNYWHSMVENKRRDKNNRFLCGYNKYDNWDLTVKSYYFDSIKIKESEACPFRFSLNQLWRNMLLAEKVEYARQLNESHFWVFAPSGNDNYLWNNYYENVENRFRSILSDEGNNRFRRFSLEDIISTLDTYELSLAEDVWLKELKHRYLI